ncbi:MAG: cyclase family protein [Cyanobacteria bacterium P01_H01_bin.74]
MQPQAIIDITAPISSELPVWPGDPPITIDWVLALDRGDPASVSRLSMGSHTGTHVDAFSHFKQDGLTLSQMDLRIYNGKSLVVEIEDPTKITMGELQRSPSFMDLRKAERVLFKTINSASQWYKQPFNPQFCFLDPTAASFLVELGIKLVGIDALSVDAFDAEDRYEEPVPTHHRLMDAGVYIIEGLVLNTVSAGWYQMNCLPLNLKDGDGAPARVTLQTLN